MESIYNKERFISEVSKFIYNYNNLHNKQVKQQKVEYGIIERCIFDKQDDDEVRSFLVKTLLNCVNLINELYLKSEEYSDYKNYQIINFICHYNIYVRPYVSELQMIRDFTGYHGDFTNIKIVVDLVNKLNSLYHENIFYNADEIKKLIHFIKHLGSSRLDMSSLPQVKPHINDEISRYLKSSIKAENIKDKRFNIIYQDLINKQVINLDDQATSNYQKLLLGNIGEQLFLKKLKDKNPYYIAGNIGDHMGYDIYYFDKDVNKEKLVEVKTTAYFKYENGSDMFYIGKTELPKLEETLKNPNADYIISRIFLEFDRNGIIKENYTTLTPLDKETLTDEYGNIYKLYKDDEGKNYFYCEELKRNNKLVRS